MKVNLLLFATTYNTIMKRANNNGIAKQTTLFGMWGKKKSNGLDDIGVDTASNGKKQHNTSPHWENVSLPNGPMLLLHKHIGGNTSLERRHTKEVLSSLPNWNDNVTFQIFGKECKMRRRICQFSTDGKIEYSYSGLKKVDAPSFPDVLYKLKCQVESLIIDYILDITKDGSEINTENSIPPEFIKLARSIKNSKGDEKGEIYNYCLLNHYRNGEEYMGYHADDEASMQQSIPIASVSLGITRSFDIRPRKKDSDGKRKRVVRISLSDGDLLLMFAPMQQHYEHSIPVEKKVVGDRINLTFRRIIT